MNEGELVTRVAVLEERLKSSEKALALQAAEYERRLDALNHAHQQALEAQSQTVPREVYEKSEADTRTWRASVNTRLDMQAGRDATKSAAVGILLGVVSLLTSLAAIFMRALGH